MHGRGLIRALATLLLLAACAAPAAQAQTQAIGRAVAKVFQDYAIDGRIDACSHTSQELKWALDHIPPDILQYAAEYPDAIEAAIEARARGECDGKKPSTGLIVPTPTPTASATPSPTPTPTAVPTKTVVPEAPLPEGADGAPVAAATPVSTAPDRALERVATATPANDAPLPLVLLGILAALLALTGLLLATLRRFGIAEERLAPAWHAWREATWRAGGVWEDFRDWLRTGR